MHFSFIDDKTAERFIKSVDFFLLKKIQIRSLFMKND